eukprot:6639771-Alexandrium_andersonii.AAC.1
MAVWPVGWAGTAASSGWVWGGRRRQRWPEAAAGVRLFQAKSFVAAPTATRRCLRGALSWLASAGSLGQTV